MPVLRQLFRFTVALLGLAFGVAPLAAQAGPAALHTRVALLSDQATITPGRPFYLGLQLAMAPNWHTYWKQAGDAGGPTQIRWRIPPGFVMDTISWPLPIRFDLGPVTSFGYEGSVLLLTRVTPPSMLPGGTRVTFSGDVDWIECEQICIPGKTAVAIQLAAGDGTPTPSPYAAEFDAARAQLPRPLPANWTTAITADSLGYTLRLTGPGTGSLRNPLFIPAMVFHFENNPSQRPVRSARGLTLVLTRVKSAAPAAILKGLLVGTDANGERVGYEFAAPVAGVVAALPTPATVPTNAVALPATSARAPEAAPASSLGLGLALVLAFFGGLVLNLMPCVLPVIALKIFSFAELGGADVAKARAHGYAFAGGVIGSFLALAGLLLALRAGGAELGWGFQLQSPAFVAGIAVLLFVLSLSLFGVVDIGTELTQLGANGFDGGYTGSAANGVLATIVATPCTAPLMGAAIAFGLQESAVVALLVFAALGVGMAAPYVVLASWPAALRHLPKPGPWMVTFKKALGLPMLATVGWLLWVFTLQVGLDGLPILLGALGTVGVGTWVMGRAIHRDTRAGILAMRIVGAVVIASGGFAAWTASAVHAAAQPAAVAVEIDAYGLAWEPWSKPLVAQRRTEGRAVFVDFTAAWCLTCKVNERVAFASSEVQQALAAQRVTLIRADWTSRDSSIATAVASYGRRGIPLYVLYPADPAKPFVLLPELLTPGIVLRALAEHGAPLRQ